MLECKEQMIDEMFDELQHAPTPCKPSKFWKELSDTNIAQLKSHGFENLRNTVAFSYFTFPGDKKQFRFLKSQLSKTTYLKNKLRALLAFTSPRVITSLRKRPMTDNCKMQTHANFLKIHTYYTQMLFDFVKKKDRDGLLDKVKDSLIGNPPPVYRNGKLITADLANSILEYYSIVDSIGPNAFNTVMELGAGYGRNAAVFLQMHPKMRYIICDIPPALYVAQSYLTARFPDRKAFLFRPFRSFEEIRDEWNQASICFLLPHQMSYLPNKSVDLFVNISSLHEMRHDQIAYYFKEIDRLVSGYFYSKQWKKSYIPQENMVINEEDYPDFPHWSRLYSRTCEVQTAFFERLSKM